MKYIFSIAIVLSVFHSSAFSQTLEFEEFTKIRGAHINAIEELSTGEVIITTPQGVWKGNQDFTQWIKISSGIADSNVTSLAIGKDDVIIVGTATGLYKTTNTGKTWAKTGNNFTNKDVRHLSVHPNGNIYAGVYKRLYRSKDNGNTWQVFADSILNKVYEAKHLYGIAHYGENNRIIVMVHYSDDDGKTWKESNSLITLGVRTYTNGFIHRYQTAPSGIIYFSYSDTLFFNLALVPGNLAMSTDNGASWSWKTYNTGIESGYGLQITKEQIHNFLYLNSKQTELQIIPLEKDTALLFPYQGSPIFVQNSYVFENSVPKEIDMNFLKSKTSGIKNREITITKRLKNGTLLLGTYGGDMYSSNDNGKNWTIIKLPIYYPVLTCYLKKENLPKTYFGTTNGLYEYNNITNTLKEFPIPKDQGSFVTDIEIRPQDTMLFVVFNNRLYRYEKENWIPIIPVNEPNYYVNDIVFHKDTLFIESTGPAYYTRNLTMWERVQKNPQLLYGTDLYNYFNKQYSLVYRFSAYFGSYFSSGRASSVGVNSGLPQSFRKSQMSGTPSYIFAVAEGSDNNDLYLGTEAGVFKLEIQSNAWVQDKKTSLVRDRVFGLACNQVGDVFAGTLTGGYVSKDKALKWSPLPSFPSRAVRSIAVDHQGFVYAGLALGGIYRSTKSSVKLSAPLLSAPIDNGKEINIASDAIWKQVPQATGYHIQISTDTLFNTLVVNDSTLNNNLLNLESLIKFNETYYWRVRGTLGYFRGDWSKIQKFTTQTVLPDKLILLNPANKAINVALNPLLRWSKSLSSDTVHLQVSKQNSFNEIIFNDTTLTVNEQILEPLSTMSEYFWRVRGKNRAGYGPWSETWSFTTQSPSAVREDDNSGMSVTVQNNHVILHYGAYSQSVKGIRITDIRGKTISSQTIEQGQSSSDFDMSGMSKGYYVVILDTHTGSISRNVIME